jgi:hypothetical protein
MAAAAAETAVRMFRFRVDYFKPSGKWYSDANFEREFRTCEGCEGEGAGRSEYARTLSYIYDVVSYIRGLRDAGGQGAMPGLTGSGWEGSILVRQVGHLGDDGVWVEDRDMPRSS